MARPKRRLIPYPTDHLLAVFDAEAEGSRAVETLAAAGFDRGDLALLVGEAGSGAMARLGSRAATWTRALRLVQFLTMDQLPDLFLYEAALADGRTIVAVHVRERAQMLAARDILRGGGAHFVNYFGRVATEEFARWRGPELELPALLRR